MGAGINVRKRLILIGAGSDTGGTKLVAARTLNVPLIQLKNFKSSNLVRITGFCFDLGKARKKVRIAISINDVSLEKLRIDHNAFHFGYEQIHIEGSKGVIDHNVFHNPVKGISYSAGTDRQAEESWAKLEPGTIDALFIEDNQFIDDENYKEKYSQERIGTFNGGKLVIRKNRWDCHRYSNSTTIDPIMTHGSAAAGVANGYWQQGTGARRGQSIVEIYDNVMEGKRIDFLAILRGGSNLVYNNKLVNEVTGVPRIFLREEEYTIDQWRPMRKDWPAEDQVHNTFIWGNLIQGKQQSAENILTGDAECAIKENRDYFLHAPRRSGGKEVFTGMNGASCSFPTDGSVYPTKGTMVFKPESPNAYFPYKAFTYPHPLTLEKAK